MLSCSIWFSAPSFWMGGGLESRCVGRVYGADGARHHPHRTQAVHILKRRSGYCILSKADDQLDATITIY